jgi:hypothetical protein
LPLLLGHHPSKFVVCALDSSIRHAFYKKVHSQRKKGCMVVGLGVWM